MTTFTWLHLSDLHVRGSETVQDRNLFEKMLVDNLVKLNLETGMGSAIVRFQHPDLSVEWRPDVFTYSQAKNGRIKWKLRLRR